MRQRRVFEAVGHDAVNAAHVVAGAKIEVFYDFVGNARRFDDFAVHVHDIQRAIRRVGHIHRAKPCVLGSEKLHLLFVGGPLGGGGRSGVGDLLVMHNVLRGIGDKGVADIFARPGVAAIDRQPARRREITRSATASFNAFLQPLDSPFRAHHSPRLLRTDAI